ncbi:MAG: diguanylate cyclase [Treponemataceae bacterium]|nr:diguanylate cyclase [Treponemataceae bacterium]
MKNSVAELSDFYPSFLLPITEIEEQVGAEEESRKEEYSPRDPIRLGWSYIRKARSVLLLSRTKEAQEWALKALELFKAHQYTQGLVHVFLFLGILFLEQGALEKSLENTTLAIELAQNMKSPELEILGLHTVGQVLLKTGEVHEALYYFLQADKKIKESSLLQGSKAFYELETLLFINLGEAFIALGETDNGAEYFSLAQEAATHVNNVGIEIRILKGLAIIQKRKGARKEALELLERAVEQAKRYSLRLYLIELWLEIGVIYIELNEYKQAIQMFTDVITESEKNGLFPYVAEGYRNRSLAYEASLHFQEALSDFKRFHETLEHISLEQTASRRRDAEILFDLEKAQREAEIFRLRNVELREHKEALERSNRQIQAVAEAGKVITSSLDIQEIARLVQENLKNLMEIEGFSLAIYEEAEEQLQFVFCVEQNESRSVPPLSLADSFHLLVWVLRHQQSIRIDDIEKTMTEGLSPLKYFEGSSARSVIGIPLTLGGAVIGTLSIHSRKRKAYSEEDVRLLESISTFVAIALQNSRHRQELLRLNEALRAEKEALEQLTRKVSRLANHDGLTGLPNRLLLAELLERAIQRSKRQKTLLAILFMDLDNFKPINDTFGHQEGDHALVEVAHRIKRALRASDVIARVGGDEFVVLLTDMENEDGARLVAEKIVKTLEQPLYIEGQLCQLGVSIGIAVYPKDGASGDELIRHADEAMYRIKRAGKNGYTFYSSL